MKNKWWYLLVGIFVAALFLRLYQPTQRFMYSHDHDLASWIIKDVVVSKHLRLIGQETSTRGIFIGPLLYYMQIPFYLLFNMDPIGGVYWAALLGAFGTFSFYFCFSRIFDRRTGLIAAFLYAISFYTVGIDREVVPTMPVVTWTAWYLYGLFLLLTGKQKAGFIILGILLALVWHLIFALVIAAPLTALATVLSKKRVDLKVAALGIVTFLTFSLPLILFETRHNFLQSKAIISSLTQNQKDILSGIEKLSRVVFLMAKNVNNFIWGDLPKVNYTLLLVVSGVTFFFLLRKKLIEKKLAIILAAWVLLFAGFFASYSKVVSEYYLNGALIAWIVILAVSINHLLSKKKLRTYGFLVLAFFGIFNIYRFFNLNINRSGYRQRKAIVSFIKEDAAKMGYPCISISYITDPGYDLGYRYLFWLENMHVNRPSSQSPVYTIVFPLKPIFKEDKSFGAIGLIYPDYKRYTKKEVEDSCSGENSNLTDPMFGYTQ
ncbi:MAG: glycosyltransferase family 39 protein [Patescibacteria group bacterium]